MEEEEDKDLHPQQSTVEEMAWLAKMVKQRDDSAKAYEEAGRMELAERERAEQDVIREFLPLEHLISYVEAILRVYNLHGRRDNK